MGALGKLLALRPTNAVARLGQASALPLLNPGDLTRALGEPPAALLCVPVVARAALGGLFRAARLADAVLGISAPFTPADRDGAARLFGEMIEAAEATGHQRPIFAQAGPIRVSQASAENVGALEEAAFRFVDAGFTLLSVDASRLAPEAAAQACARIAQPALERELPVELALPRVARSGSALEEWLEALRAERLPPRYLRVEASSLVLGGGPEGEAAPDFDRIRELALVAAGQGAALTLEDDGAVPFRLAGSLVEAGVRKLDAAEVFARIAAQVLPGKDREKLSSKARAAQLPLSDLLALVWAALSELPAPAAERIEAMSFFEAEGWLEALGGAGSARRAANFLAHRSGY
ncbi:MAG: hypothetical protein HYZ28_16910 [Myxococcales bacterium]|nr:hypothetical protein [Myxococcales bacterium]